MYSIQGLWTAAEHGLPVAFIIVNNSSYRALEEFGRHFHIDELPGVKLPHLDFSALAAGHGVKSIRVQHCDQLDAALREIFAAEVPMLLQVDVQSSSTPPP